jgi:arginine decarboxylase
MNVFRKVGKTLKRDHTQTPYYSKLKAYAEGPYVSHDVPGHKRGELDNDMIRFVGKTVFRLDANAPRGLDNLNNPTGVIKEAADLMADAFGADKAYFLTGGTTMGILSMIMSVCRAKEKIILPRNVHKSAINALILSGAVPIFVKPHIDSDLGIANHVTVEDMVEAINDNPDAKAVLVINPTYFGVVSDLDKITKAAHEAGMIVMADEAHGSHFPFSDELPMGAMEAGADMASCSLHKTVGSLTQSSILIAQGVMVDHVRLRSTINMLQSTSPSGLLLSSLDVARKTIVTEGPKLLSDLIRMAQKTRERIDAIEGLSSPSKGYFESLGAYAFDETKIIVKVSGLGVSGFDIFKVLFDRFKIQVELAESHIILCVLSAGTSQSDLDALVDALETIASETRALDLPPYAPRFIYTWPEYFTRPREAYHAPKTTMPIHDAAGQIAAESVMIYPPGIPIVIPGEVISDDIIDDLQYYKEQGSVILSDTEQGMIRVVDKDNWFKWEDSDEVD